MDESGIGLLLTRARSLHEQGRHYEAHRLLRRFEQLAGEGSLTARQVAEVGLVRALLALGSADFAVAEEHGRRARAAAGDDAVLHAEVSLALARALARTDRFGECADVLEDALARVERPGVSASPELRFELHRQLGQALEAAERLEEAGARYLEAHEIGSQLHVTDTERGQLISQLRFDAYLCLADARRAAELVPQYLREIAAEGIADADWRYIVRLISRADAFGSDEVKAWCRAWYREAEAEYERRSDAPQSTATSPRTAELEMLVEYQQRAKRAHPRDLRQADVQEVEPLFERAWGLMETSQLRDWLSDVCYPLTYATRWKTALSLWRRLYQRADHLAGCSQRDLAEERARVAEMLVSWCAIVGEADSIEPLQRLVLECDAAAGDHLFAAFGGRRLAGTVLACGDHEQALRLLDEARQHWRRRSGHVGTPEPTWARWLRAKIAEAQGDATSAERLLREELAEDLEERGEGHSVVVWDRTALAEFLCSHGRLAEAREQLRESRALLDDPEERIGSYEPPPGSRDFDRLVLRLTRARLAAKLGEPDAADELRAIVRDADTLLGRGSAPAAEAMTEWAAAEWAAGHRNRAVRDAAKASLRAQRRLRWPEHPAVVRAREVMRQVCASEAARSPQTVMELDLG